VNDTGIFSASFFLVLEELGGGVCGEVLDLFLARSDWLGV